MKRKAAVRYLLHSYRNPLLIFYGIILLVSLLVCTLMEVQVAGEGKVSSVNGASVIFLFVCGLNAFKEDFCFFLEVLSGNCFRSFAICSPQRLHFPSICLFLNMTYSLHSFSFDIYNLPMEQVYGIIQLNLTC